MNVAMGWVKPRRDSIDVSPDYEDFGLFKGDICQLQVELTPNIDSNGRADVLVEGFANKNASVTVVFAGRRRLLFGPLQSRIRAQHQKYERALRQELGMKVTPEYDLSDVRLPTLIEGSWRFKFAMDPDGFQQKISQFIAARWVYTSVSGELKTFGTLPITGKRRS